MKKLLNTLFVTTEGAALRKDGENIVAEVESTERARVPLHMLGSVVVFGVIFVSPPLIETLAAAGITLVLLDRAGRFRARVEGPQRKCAAAPGTVSRLRESRRARAKYCVGQDREPARSVAASLA